MKIVDGKGTGFQAEVDNEHRLSTKSTTSDEQVVSNIDSGEAFTVATGTASIPSSADHVLLFFKNESADRSVVIDSYTVSHSGGTNGDKNIKQTFYIGSSDPTAGNAEGTTIPLNTRSPITPEVKFEVWDDVLAGGMTQASQGTSFGDQHFARGFQQVPILSKFVIGPGGSLTAVVATAETSNVSMSLAFHLLEKGQGI